MDGFKKFQRFSAKELLLYNRIEAFSKIFIRSRKMHHVELNSGTSKSSKWSVFAFEDIDLRESCTKLHKNQVELWQKIEFKG